MEHGKSCCFSGHRPSKLPWGYDESDPRCVEFKEKLSAVIGAVYDSGIKHFICGMALGCDMYCAEAVISLKKMHSEDTLQAAVPYRGQADNWNEYNRLRYDRIIDNCDEVTVLAESYSPGHGQRPRTCDSKKSRRADGRRRIRRKKRLRRTLHSYRSSRR